MSFSSYALTTIAQKAAAVRNKAGLRELMTLIEKSELSAEDRETARQHYMAAFKRVTGGMAP